MHVRNPVTDNAESKAAVETKAIQDSQTVWDIIVLGTQLRLYAE